MLIGFLYSFLFILRSSSLVAKYRLSHGNFNYRLVSLTSVRIYLVVLEYLLNKRKNDRIGEFPLYKKLQKLLINGLLF